jgi:hypothetical protein
MGLFRKFRGGCHERRQDEEGSGDRSRVAAGEDYEICYFAEKHGITKDQVRDLIKRHGNSRDLLGAEAQKLAKGR